MTIIKKGDILYDKTKPTSYGRATEDGVSSTFLAETTEYTPDVRYLEAPRRKNWGLTHNYTLFPANPAVASVGLLVRKGVAEW